MAKVYDDDKQQALADIRIWTETVIQSKDEISGATTLISGAKVLHFAETISALLDMLESAETERDQAVELLKNIRSYASRAASAADMAIEQFGTYPAFLEALSAAEKDLKAIDTFLKECEC